MRVRCRSIEPRHLGKSRNDIRAFRIDVGDLDEEIEPAVGIVAVACFGHGSSSLHAGRHSASPVFCENRKMTNSAGFTGATTPRQMSRPSSTAAGGVRSEEGRGGTEGV